MSDIGQEDFRVQLEDGKYTAIRLVGGGTQWLRHAEPWVAATDGWQHSKAINALIDRVHELEVKLYQKGGDAPEVGTRAAHYGDGRQPWDDILEQGWGPAFAAGNALKYVRRYKNKNGEDDLKKARWYYHELITRANQQVTGLWIKAFTDLEELLTTEERVLLRQP